MNSLILLLISLFWNHTCISQNDPMVGEALRQWGQYSAIQDCGYSSNPDISVFYKRMDTFLGWANPAVDPTVTYIASCTIIIDPNFRDSQKLFTHEVGHCLGLVHTTFPCIMNPTPVEFCAEEITRIRELYPPRPPLPYQRILAGVTRE